MGNYLLNKTEHMERVEKINKIIDKIVDERNITRNELFIEIKVNIFYMDKFLSGVNPNFPNTKVLERLAEASNGVVTYEELLRITGYSKVNYIKADPSQIKRGDIFWCNLGVGVGSEQSGLRPCIILQNNTGNAYSPTVIIAPISSQLYKAKLPTHIEIGQSEGMEKTSVILLEQQRVVDKKRLGDFISRVTSKEKIEKINKAYKISGGVFSFTDQLLEKLDTIDENSKTQLGVFKKLFNILFNKYKNKELVFSNNRTA